MNRNYELLAQFIVLTIIMLVVCIGCFVDYVQEHPKNFVEDRGQYVKKELVETRHFSLREDSGEISFMGVVPCVGNGNYGFQPSERIVLLVVTEKGSILYRLDGQVLARTEDTQGNGVYCWKQEYYVLPCKRASWGLSYDDNRLAIRNEVLCCKGYDLRACEGTSEYQNYDVRQLDNKTLELTKTYEYVWKEDIHFAPIKGIKGFFDYI